MDFPIKVTVDLSQSNIADVSSRTITIHSGITTLLGPNGSGKTQLLRGLKTSVGAIINKKIRYVSAGRLGPLESYRSDLDGRRGGTNFDSAQYGDKNSLRYRHQSETVLGDFATLAARPDILIKIQERLRRLFKRDVHIDWDAGYLKIFFNRIDQQSVKYSSSREASGLLHLVAILAALYDDEVGLVLIDEPEVSLHPQLQAFLLNEIASVAGNPDWQNKKLVIISTHSTEYIELRSVNDLASIVFCHDIYEEPVQVDPSAEEFKGRKLQSLLSRMSQEHKLALFSSRPLLVEGPSDQILCAALGRKLDLNIEAAGSQILPVTGKGQIPTVIKLFRTIGKHPSLLADADAITDSLDIVNVFTSLDSAQSKAEAMGHRDANKFARDVYNDFCQLISSKWNDIERYSVSHPYWVNRDTGKDELIAKRRSAFCVLMANKENILLNLPAEWGAIKTRLNTLLKLLEHAGCFILKKGAIEAYYINASQLTADEKPNAAAIEAASILDMETEKVKECYLDIVTALEFAARTGDIDEARAIRDMVLAIAAPAIASLEDNAAGIEINSLCQSLFGDKSKLFRIEVGEDNKDKYLIIHLESKILCIDGFPLKIVKGSNPIVEVNRQMGI